MHLPEKDSDEEGSAEEQEQEDSYPDYYDEQGQKWESHLLCIDKIALFNKAQVKCVKLVKPLPCFYPKHLHINNDNLYMADPKFGVMMLCHGKWEMLELEILKTVNEYFIA